MKILLIILISIASLKSSFGQKKIDSSYFFSPGLYKKNVVTKKVDSLLDGKILILMKVDSGDANYLDVCVKKDEVIVEQGRYRLAKVDSVNNWVFSRDGTKRDVLSKVKFQYVREGYWQYIRRKKTDEVFYKDGKLIKMKINI